MDKKGKVYRRGLVHTAVVIHAVGNRLRKEERKVKIPEGFDHLGIFD